jgi:parallel beta-helix repeat protein
VVVFVLTGATAVDAAESVETCSSCSECEFELTSGSYSSVVLDADIIDHPGSCIVLQSGESNLTFDCAGHLIDGDGIRGEPAQGGPDRAITMMQGSDNTVRNCTITDFDAAIYLVNTSGMVLEDNDLEGNWVGIDLSNGDSNTISGNVVRGGEMGIKITNSDNNTVASNTVCPNIPWDFYHESSTGNSGIENMCDTTWYWNDIGTTSGCTYSCTIFSCGFETGDFGEWSDSSG